MHIASRADISHRRPSADAHFQRRPRSVSGTSRCVFSISARRRRLPRTIGCGPRPSFPQPAAGTGHRGCLIGNTPVIATGHPRWIMNLFASPAGRRRLSRPEDSWARLRRRLGRGTAAGADSNHAMRTIPSPTEQASVNRGRQFHDLGPGDDHRRAITACRQKECYRADAGQLTTSQPITTGRPRDGALLR
jgi:hypothetical protein